MGLFSSIRKSRRLRGISRRLDSGTDLLTLEDIMRDNGAQKRAEEDLYDLVEGDEGLRKVLRAHGASRETLRVAYDLLLMAGCGQWARGHWVAASSLAFPVTLDFVLRTVDVKNRIAPLRVISLVKYFETGRTGALSGG